MNSLSLKILKLLNCSVIGKTYTIENPINKKPIFSEAAGIIHTYYVIRHPNDSISLIKDEKIDILPYDDAFYNPWKSIKEKAIEENLEIHNLEHWCIQSTEKNEKVNKKVIR